MKRPAVKCPHTPPQDDPLEIFEDPIQPEGPGDTGGAGEPGDSEVVDAPDGPDEIDSKLFDSMKRELVQMEGAIAFWKLQIPQGIYTQAILSNVYALDFELSLVRRNLGAAHVRTNVVYLFKDIQECFKLMMTQFQELCPATPPTDSDSDPLE